MVYWSVSSFLAESDFWISWLRQEHLFSEKSFHFDQFWAKTHRNFPENLGLNILNPPNLKILALIVQINLLFFYFTHLDLLNRPILGPNLDFSVFLAFWRSRFFMRPLHRFLDFLLPVH